MTNDSIRIAIAAAFIASLVTAQFLAVKILAIPLPTAVPIVGPEVLVPAGVVAIGVTFLATDCYTELYGPRAARRLVNIGFAMILLMLILLWVAIWLPGTDAGVDPDLFGAVLAPSTNIIVGGLLAYLVSQHWDVFAFHRIKRLTQTRYLWIRNLGSTVTSQGIDTVVFILTAFWVAPSLLGIGEALPAIVLASLILGQYLAKIGIAVLDTPFVYLVVGYARSRGEGTHPAVPAD